MVPDDVPAEVLNAAVSALTGLPPLSLARTAAYRRSPGKLFAVPFYAEASITYFRTDLFAKANLTMPAEPTWDQIRGFAALGVAEVHGYVPNVWETERLELIGREMIPAMAEL